MHYKGCKILIKPEKFFKEQESQRQGKKPKLSGRVIKLQKKNAKGGEAAKRRQPGLKSAQ